MTIIEAMNYALHEAHLYARKPRRFVIPLNRARLLAEEVNSTSLQISDAALIDGRTYRGVPVAVGGEVGGPGRLELYDIPGLPDRVSLGRKLAED